ncbi:MAG: helix-turn-helix domain-containing protein [Oscillospiraceae bacterium]|nr:helix-turn-helix domain-containing protein [Oscillospiraceae bacterium]
MTKIITARSSVGALEQATDENPARAGHCVNVQAHDNTAGSNWQEKLALRPREMAAALGIGYNAAYALCKSEGFSCLWVGRSCIIPTDALRRWLDNQVGGVVDGDF